MMPSFVNRFGNEWTPATYYSRLDSLRLPQRHRSVYTTTTANRTKSLFVRRGDAKFSLAKEIWFSSARRNGRKELVFVGFETVLSGFGVTEEMLEERIQLGVRFLGRRVVLAVGHGDAVGLAEELVDCNSMVEPQHRRGPVWRPFHPWHLLPDETGEEW